MYNTEIVKITDYRYKADLFYTNQSSAASNYVTIKLILNSSNFNFDLNKDDGSDFRLIDSRNDMATLNMWVAKWDKTNKKAVLFFGLPYVGPYSVIKLIACFGNYNSSNISNPDSVGFKLAYRFDSSVIDINKWSGFTTSTITNYGYRLPSSQGTTINSVTSPLSGINNWAIEFGLYADFDDLSITSTYYMSAGVEFSGAENPFVVGLLQTSIVRHNAVVPNGATYENSVVTEGGLEGYSYNEIKIVYSEVIDSVIVDISSRNNYKDSRHIISRKVEGDTDLSNILINGRHVSGVGTAGGYPTYIQWIAISENDGLNLHTIDGSSLYFPYELIQHQDQDFRPYGENVVKLQNCHESSFGGNPYLLTSNNIEEYWCSYQNAVSEEEIFLSFYTTLGDNIVDKSYQHYDSGHELYLNASKLSEPLIDEVKKYQSTLLPSWVSIEFEEKQKITSFKILPTDELEEMPKDYVFMGSNHNPYNDINEAVVLCSGIFAQTSNWIPVELNNEYSYKYYILKIITAYGGTTTSMKRWYMSNYHDRRKKYVTQLRLLPPADSNASIFPKEIMLLGSNDDVNWQMLIPWTYTYTPFISHINEYGFWQYYNFHNTHGYKYYRLKCRGNWGHESGFIGINKLSLHEMHIEEHYNRVLRGTSNNIKQVWATNDISLDNGIGRVFISNDYLNIVTDNKLKLSVILPDNYNDMGLK